jgi:hypothetical protein
MPLQRDRARRRIGDGVHQPGLQAGEDITQRQQDRTHAAGLEGALGDHVVLRDPQLGGLEVGAVAQRLRAHQVGEADVGRRQQLVALGLEALREHRVHLRARPRQRIPVLEQEGHAVDLRVRVDRRKLARRQHPALQLAQADLADHDVVAAHDAAGIELHLHAAGRGRLDLGGGGAQLAHPGRAIGRQRGDLDHLLGHGLRRGEQRGGGEQERGNGATRHQK